jgi:hypothetical protein
MASHHEAHEVREGFGNNHIKLLNFVLFPTFVIPNECEGSKKDFSLRSK